jgi:hypothetical protein
MSLREVDIIMSHRAEEAGQLSIAMGWTAGVRFPAGARDFSLHHNIQTPCLTQPPSQFVQRNLIQRPQRKSGHLFQSRMYVNNAGTFTQLQLSCCGA